MGNSRWRLATTLEYVARALDGLVAEGEVEVIVTDWSSDSPLADALALSPVAARLVSFIQVPADLARRLQGDSPFPEVLALNAAARRARGKYVGRIDQDTLVGRQALALLLDLCRGRLQLDSPPERALFFSNLRMVPYRFAVLCPPLPMVERFVDEFGPKCPIEFSPGAPFYCHSVGIWLLARVLWEECGGYDERMIYMNGMEINMIARLRTKYAMVDLGARVDHAFFHLEHYHPWQLRKSGVYRRENDVGYKNPLVFNPNGSSWGLGDYVLQTAQISAGNQRAVNNGAPTRWSSLMFAMILWRVRILAPVDRLCNRVTRARHAIQRSVSSNQRRLLIARNAIAGQPLGRRPAIILGLWRRWRERQPV